MRIAIAMFVGLMTILALPLAAQRSARGSGAEKIVKGGKAAPAGPKEGIKAPGVQIPFALLKAEAELPMAPAWMAATDALVVPAAQGGLIKIDQRSNKAGEPVAGVAKPCGGAVVGFNSLWTADCGAGAVVRLDSKTWKPTATLAVGAGMAQPAIAVTADSVWAFTDNRTTLSRIDPEQNVVVSQMRFPADCNSLAFAETALWIVCPTENQVYRVNPLTDVVEKHIEVSTNPRALAFGENSVWVLCLKEGKVDRIDPKTNKVTKTIDLGIAGSAGGGIAIGSGSVWVTLDGFPLTRIDVAQEKVVQQFWGAGGGAIQFAFNALWLDNLHEGTLWRIDPKRVAATLAE
jgi:virginiamycin B lyase